MIEQFNLFRPDGRNVNVAVGKGHGVIEYFNFHDWASSYTASKEFVEMIARKYDLQMPAATIVPLVTLAELLIKHFPDHVPDFINIDVENLDVDVLKSGDWKRWRPKVVAIEDIEFRIEAYMESEIYRFMTGSG